jgi:phage terminase large subunit-like protein
LEEEATEASRNKIKSLFPATGSRRRELYPKHLEFFKLGATHNERAFIAANRVGKTLTACYELSCHLTGWYPDFWEGRRFSNPVRVWACGDTAKNVRDILQTELLGPHGDETAQGTGLIPADSIIRKSVKHGLSDAVDTVYVRHVSGGASACAFKSYDQGRVVFQGTSQEVVLLDEECPEDIYAEALTRCLTVNGIVMLTFTPLNGLTPLVLSYLPHMAPTPVAA